MDLHTNIYQYLWNLLVITLNTTVHVHLLCVYAEVGSLDLILKSCQQFTSHIESYISIEGLMMSWVALNPFFSLATAKIKLRLLTIRSLSRMESATCRGYPHELGAQR
jgi:hypothetical protein